MKKFAIWMLILSGIVFVVAWGIVGLKIFNNEYDFVTEAYIAYASLVVFFICLIYVRSTYRCPHCGKQKIFFGKYCPYCGKEIK